MTSRTNIPITKENRIFHTLHYNYKEDKIPLQYALELNTLDLQEAEEKKEEIMLAMSIKRAIDRIKSRTTQFDYQIRWAINDIMEEAKKNDT